MEQLKHVNIILKRFISGIYTCEDANRIMDMFRSQQYTKEINEEMDLVWQSVPEKETDSLQHEQYTAEARAL